MRNINHFRLFTHALRTAILFAAGFLVYEILNTLEEKWELKNTENKENKENKEYYLYQKQFYSLIFIFFIDLIILYGMSFAFGTRY